MKDETNLLDLQSKKEIPDTQNIKHEDLNLELDELTGEYNRKRNYRSGSNPGFYF